MAKLEDLTPNASIRGVLPDGVHATDVSDLMRRMVKESLLKFDRAEALSYNALVQSWPEIVRLANQSGSAGPAQAELL